MKAYVIIVLLMTALDDVPLSGFSIKLDFVLLLFLSNFVLKLYYCWLCGGFGSHWQCTNVFLVKSLVCII